MPDSKATWKSIISQGSSQEQDPDCMTIHAAMIWREIFKVIAKGKKKKTYKFSKYFVDI